MHCVTLGQKSINCSLTLPLSKSILNRLLVINHLSGGGDVDGLTGEASDVVGMLTLLRQIRDRNADTDAISEINVGNAGTVMRFLTAVLSVSPGRWLITGSERMQQRPVKPLTDALQSLGAVIAFGKQSGFPPVRIQGNPHLKGGSVKLNAGVSSQFISALMMIAPLLRGGVTIELQGDITSGSYIRMTLALMQKAGADVTYSGNTIVIKEQNYTSFDFETLAEPDWSAAAFWYQVAALAIDPAIILKGLRPDSVQGDSVLPAIYARLGVATVFTEDGVLISKSGLAVDEFNYDFTDCPDLAQAVVVTCAALGIKGRFIGLKTLRVKETDRIEALRTELGRMGYGVDVNDDQIILDGNPPVPQTTSATIVINCYDDHRMAMSFAPLALIHKRICLDEPEVVKKSYPGFWKDMVKAGFGADSE